MVFRSGNELRLAEDEDPARFPSERSRRRAIGFDRWAGRHPVLVTALSGAALALLLWWALPDAPGPRFTARLIGYSLAAVVFTAQVGWMARKARKRYYGR